jgi:hypothetical protein
MTTFTIALADGRTAQVEADEVTTRQDGSLWLLKATAPKPAALVPVAIFAARTWSSCMQEGAQILWLDVPAKPAGVSEPSQRSPRFA